MSIDGIDCCVNEPYPFNRNFYSPKFKSAGLRYEVGLSLHCENILWVHGPFECGLYNDQKLFNIGLKHLIKENEKIVADNGYTCS